MDFSDIYTYILLARVVFVLVGLTLSPKLHKQ